MYTNMMKIKEKTQEKTIYECLAEYGVGIMTEYNPVEGIRVCYSDFHMNEPYEYTGEYDISHTIEINYCLTGKYDCEFDDQTIITYSDGDFAIASGYAGMTASDSSSCPYKGITVFVDVRTVKNELHKFIDDVNIGLDHLVKNTLSGKTCIVAKPGKKILHIFTELYELPSSHEADYIRIKVIELLLLIYTGDFKYKEDSSKYFTKNAVESAKKARKYIDKNFSRRLTIDFLAKKFFINKNQLMACFKYIYGMTINEYLKKTRMECALVLLKTTNMKISDIASRVGYANPSKFSESFKKLYMTTPATYKKNNIFKM